MTLTLLTFLALLILQAAAPLFAYTIFMTDGSSLQAKEKYKIVGDRALITLQNGNQTFLPAKKIDVARTEQANTNDYGSAVVIDDTHQAPTTAAPPPAKKTLADLIHNNPAEPRALPPARRETRGGAGTSAKNATPATLGKTRGGFPDLPSLTRKPFSQVEVAAELQQFFHGQGVEEVEIYQGTQEERPLVEVTTNSEGGVFKALAVSATALLRIHDKHPKIGTFELLMMTPSRDRAGQFVLTSQAAADIVARKIEVSAFYLSSVQF